jgi:hypothetical protein
LAAEVPLVPTVQAVMDVPAEASNPNAVATNARKSKLTSKPLEVKKN